MIVDGRAHLDLLDLDDLLLLAGFGGFLLLFVFELAVVHELDHGRLGFGRHFHEVETLLLRDGAGFVDTDFTEFVTVSSDQEDGAGEYLLIHTGPILRRWRGGRCKTSGYYDTLPSNAARNRIP